MSFVNTVGAYWIQRGLAILFMIFLIAVTVIHSKKTIAFAKKDKKEFIAGFSHKFKLKEFVRGTSHPSLYRKTSHILTLIVLILYCLNELNFLFDIWSIFPNANCRAVKLFAYETYHLAKACLYAILTLRLKLAFGDSVAEPCVRWLTRLVWFLVITYGIFYSLVADPFLTSGEPDKLKDGYFLCKAVYPMWGIIMFNTYDLLISCLCLALFYIPLNRLVKSINNDRAIISPQSTSRSQPIEIESRAAQKGKLERYKAEDKMAALLTKYAILATVAIVSTLLLILVYGVATFGILVMVDNVVNSVCMIFFSSWYDDWYVGMCRPCIVCAESCRRIPTHRLKALQSLSNIGSESNPASSDAPDFTSDMVTATSNASRDPIKGDSTIEVELESGVSGQSA